MQMFQMFMNGLMAGFGFAISVAVVATAYVYLSDPLTKAFSGGEERMEFQGVEVTNRNIYVSGEDSIFAADFKAPALPKKFEQYSLEIELRTDGGALITNCYRRISSRDAESQKPFPYTLVCNSFTDIPQIGHVMVRLVGENE